MVFYRLECLIMNGLEGSSIPFELEFLRHSIWVVRGFEFSPNRKNYRHRIFQDVQGYCQYICFFFSSSLIQPSCSELSSVTF